MSTYSPSLRIELITTGDQAGTWGNTTNNNLGTFVEASIAGYTSVSVTSANQAFTALNGAPDEARHMTIALTTTTGANFAVYAPPAEKTYVIYNASLYTATIYNSTVLGNTTAAGAGVAIPAGKTVTVWTEGTNFAFQNNHLSSLTLATDLAVADGGTGASSFTSGGILRGNGTSALSVASGADIVAAIGATAVTNAANLLNPGPIVMQTGATPTTAVTIGTDQSVTFAQTANLPNTFGFKNRIINGAMVVDQRNAGASVTPTGTAYTLDRWALYPTQASKLSVQQSTTAPAGFTNSTLITSLSAYSVLTGDFFAFGQRIEGFNVTDLGWGTASAQTVTLSFWVRSSLTGTFGGSLVNSAATRSYPFTYTVNSANTYEQKTVTIVGDTSGTWVTNNGIGIALYFGLGVGSTYAGTAGSWSGNYYFSATGATSVVGTNGATFYITGVQLERGSTATSFDFRDYGRELILCQRYYERQAARQYISYNTGNVPTVLTGQWSVTKRATPTVSVSSDIVALAVIDTASALGSVAWNMGVNGAGSTGVYHSGTIIGSIEL